MKNNPSLLRRIFSHTLLIINILLIVWTALCIAAAYISPAKVSYLALTNLSLPFTIALNIFFILFWIIFSTKKLRSLLSVLVLLAGYNVFLTVFGLHLTVSNDIKESSESFKVLTWNVHGLGIFEKKNKKRTGKEILTFIKNENADIVCLPEYYTPKDDSVQTDARIILLKEYEYYKFCFDNTVGSNTLLGTAIFSKFPLENYKVYHLGNERINVLQCDIHTQTGKAMRIIFLHLHSFGFTDYDKTYIEALKSKGIETNMRSDIFSWKLNYSYGMRANEADTVAQVIQQSPYPVMICGDLNDLPGSYTYMKIRGDLNDAFVDKGKGLGRTYNELSPTLRIDHIFYDPSILQILGYKCAPTTLSDHRPVIVNFKPL